MLFWLSLLPKNLLSRLTGWVVHRRLPEPIRTKSLRWFADRYKINLDEAELPLADYPSIGALFARRLKPGLRPVKGLLVHPADAQLTEQGVIHAGQAVQVKGKTYSVEQLIGGLASPGELEGGYYMTYYLCPTDYHRVHSPLTGEIVRALHIPGALWPVNALSVGKINQLFLVNERMVVEIASVQGPVYLVMVGATNVGKMTASFDPTIVTNQGHRTEERRYQPGLKINVGEEVGIFHMGSTVVMIYPRGVVTGSPKSGPVRWGEALY